MNEKPTGIRIIVKELLKDKLALASLILLAVIFGIIFNMQYYFVFIRHVYL